VGDAPMPSYLIEGLETWRSLMPTWKIRLWTNDNISEFPLDLVNKAEKGAQKADILRYMIVEKYGGVYVDADIIPHRSLEPILALGEAVVCHDNDLTWNYIINAFFAAVPHHPMMKKACELCLTAELNTPDIQLKTGPRLLAEAIHQADTENVVLLPMKFFYRNESYDGRLGCHLFAKQW